VTETPALRRTLGPLLVWGLGVGYVISGMYFGWNLGLPEGGPYGMLVATGLVTVMYVAFVLSYAELACAMPGAGGAFVYASRAFGSRWGLFAGLAQWVEFVFAPPAIAAAIGAYFHLLFPALPPNGVAVACYLVFTSINVLGVKHSAALELGLSAFAVAEILVFGAVTLPRFRWAEFSRDPLPNGWAGILPAIPYAIWFYLAIEGVANVAEETKKPQRDLPLGFGASMATLVLLAAIVFFGAIGVRGWEHIVYVPPDRTPSDSPLPLALGALVGNEHVLYHLLVGIGLFGLLASFHGILLAAGRATFALARDRRPEGLLARVHATRGTPAPALWLNMAVGTAALFSGKTSELITISVFGALSLYAVSTVALFRLRRAEPDLERPFRTPMYPFVPAVALLLIAASVVALALSNPRLALGYAVSMALAVLVLSRMTPAHRGEQERP
jgi:ethanolamine permease